MEFCFVVDKKSIDPSEPIYLILEHPEGFSAYLVGDIGGDMSPVSHGVNPEDIAFELQRADTDESVGMVCEYWVLKDYSPLSRKGE